MQTPHHSSNTEGPASEPTIGGGLTKDFKQQADEIAEQAKAKAKEVAQSGQTSAADQLDHLAEGVRRSAENFDDEQAWVRQGLSSAAERIERFSTTLRDRELGDLVQDAENAARRHPVVFAATCVVAGFALVRFLKSSRRGASHAPDMSPGKGAASGIERSSRYRGSEYSATSGLRP